MPWDGWDTYHDWTTGRVVLAHRSTGETWLAVRPPTAEEDELIRAVEDDFDRLQEVARSCDAFLPVPAGWWAVLELLPSTGGSQDMVPPDEFATLYEPVDD